MEKDDYYLDGQDKILGEWQGKEIERLGLSGKVKKEDYHKIIENKKPDGSRLTCRTKKIRRIGLDFTFSPPKSVSIAHELAGENGKGDKRLLDAFHAAVRKTVKLMEQDAEIRDMNSKKGHKTDNLLCAKFTHMHTRPSDNGKPDPQMHLHCLVINASYDKKREKWYAVDLGKLKKNTDKKYQPYFWETLREEVGELGYKTRDNGKNFEIDGISREMIDKFSLRTAKITKEAERKGLTVKQKANLGAKNRNKKKPELPAAELHKYWYDKLNGDEKEALKNLLNTEAENERRKEKDSQAQLERTIQERSKSNLQNTTSLSSQPSLSRQKQSNMPSRSFIRRNVEVNSEQYTQYVKSNDDKFKEGQIITSKSRNNQNRTYTITGVDDKQGNVTLQNELGRSRTVSQKTLESYPRYTPQQVALKEGDRLEMTRSGKDEYRPRSHGVEKGEICRVMKQPQNAKSLHLQAEFDGTKVIMSRDFGHFQRVSRENTASQKSSNDPQRMQLRQIESRQNQNTQQNQTVNKQAQQQQELETKHQQQVIQRAQQQQIQAQKQSNRGRER